MHTIVPVIRRPNDPIRRRMNTPEQVFVLDTPYSTSTCTVRRVLKKMKYSCTGSFVMY